MISPHRHTALQCFIDQIPTLYTKIWAFGKSRNCLILHIIKSTCLLVCECALSHWNHANVFKEHAHIRTPASLDRGIAFIPSHSDWYLYWNEVPIWHDKAAENHHKRFFMDVCSTLSEDEKNLLNGSSMPSSSSIEIIRTIETAVSARHSPRHYPIKAIYSQLIRSWFLDTEKKWMDRAKRSIIGYLLLNGRSLHASLHFRPAETVSM